MTIRFTFLTTLAATLSLATVAALVPTVARAQDAAAPAAAAPGARGGRRGGGASPVAAAFRSVHPTADQQTKFDTLETKFKADSTAEGAKPREVEMQFRKDTENLLTPEQAPKFKESLATGTVMGRLRRLNLTPEEVAKIKPAIKDTALQMDAVQSDTALKGKDKRTKLEELSTQLKAQIKPLLTPDQATQLDTLTFTGGGRRGGGAAAPAAPAAPPAP